MILRFPSFCHAAAAAAATTTAIVVATAVAAAATVLHWLFLWAHTPSARSFIWFSFGPLLIVLLLFHFPSCMANVTSGNCLIFCNFQVQWICNEHLRIRSKISPTPSSTPFQFHSKLYNRRIIKCNKKTGWAMVCVVWMNVTRCSATKWALYQMELVSVQTYTS